MENRLVHAVVRWLVILSMPFFLGLGMIRAIIAWDYPGFEYSRIEPDAYGFTPEERLALAHGTLDYLRRPEPAPEVIYLLEDLRLPGTDQPLYNAGELGHMIDVKVLTDAIRQIAYITGVVVLVGLLLLLFPSRTRPFGWRTLKLAGLATVILLAILALSILIIWPIFFEQFHELLFPPGSWTFAYSDSLIRLFPEKFWFDFGIMTTVGTLVLGVLVAVAGHLMSRHDRQSDDRAADVITTA